MRPQTETQRPHGTRSCGAAGGRHPVYTYRWPSYLSLSVAADGLQRVIRGNSVSLPSHFILVGHSMGGLVASQALTGGPGLRDRVVRIVTLGTPFSGTQWDWAGFLATSIDEASTGSEFLIHLAQSRRVRTPR